MSVMNRWTTTEFETQMTTAAVEADVETAPACDLLYDALRHVIRIIDGIASMQNGWTIRGSPLCHAYLYARGAIRDMDDEMNDREAVLRATHPRWLWRALAYEIALFGLDQGRPHAIEAITLWLMSHVAEVRHRESAAAVLQAEAEDLLLAHCRRHGLKPRSFRPSPRTLCVRPV